MSDKDARDAARWPIRTVPQVEAERRRFVDSASRLRSRGENLRHLLSADENAQLEQELFRQTKSLREPKN